MLNLAIPVRKSLEPGIRKDQKMVTLTPDSQDREENSTSHRTWDAVKALLSFTAAIISKVASVIKMHQTRMRLFH